MIFEFLARHEFLHWFILACGVSVISISAWFLSGIVLEIIYGFVRACDFQSFKRKVGKQDGKPYVFRFRYFFGAWYHLTGFRPGDSVTEMRGHRYLGFRKHVILGKFVNDPKAPDADESETDDDFL